MTKIWFWLLLVVGILAAILLFWFFWGLISYILVALVISAILHPITDYINDIEIFGWRVPRIVAVLLSFSVLALALFLFVQLFIPLIIDQVNIVQKMESKTLLARLESPINSVEEFVRKNFPDKSRKKGFLEEEILKYLKSSVNIGSVLNYIISITSSIVFYIIAVSFITFFFLYEKGMFRRTVLALVPNAYFEMAVTTFYKIEKLLLNYLVGILGQMTIMFTIISVGLSIMGIKYALTIAVFMAFMNLIPYLGPALGCVFASLVILSTPSVGAGIAHNGYTVLRVLPIIMGAIAFDSLFVQPFIYSKSVKAHPLSIFFAIFIGATVAGGLGMFMAIPVYTVLRVSAIELRKSIQQYKIFRA